MSDEVLPIRPDVEFYTNVDLDTFEVYVDKKHVGTAESLRQAWLIAGRAFIRAFYKDRSAR